MTSRHDRVPSFQVIADKILNSGMSVQRQVTPNERKATGNADI
jgi:hypothetical protein